MYGYQRVSAGIDAANDNMFLYQRVAEGIDDKPDDGNTTFPAHTETNSSIDEKEQQSNRQSMYNGDDSQVAEIEITQPSYFENSNPHKVIPFYCSDNRTLYLIDAIKYNFKNKIQINEQSIGEFSRTVITPRGDIYIMGGIIKNQEINKVLKYDYTEEKFVEKFPMIYPRSSFAAVFADKASIFVIGGKREGVPCSDCERYDIAQNKWKAISSLNYAACASSVCSYNNQYLYKFGGIGPVQQQNNNYVERFDIQRNNWEVIHLMHEDMTGVHSIGHQKMFAFFFNSGAVQVNDGTIYIFGGQLEKKMQNSSFCFNIRKENVNNKPSVQHVLNRFDYIPLTQVGSFTSNPIIHDNKIICLQNIDHPMNLSSAQNRQKRLLIFDGQRWSESIQIFH